MTASGATNSFTPGGPAVVVDAGVTITSQDADLTMATLTISPGTLQSGDVLNFTSQNGITGSYSGGVLTLTGSATPAQYQAALQSVTFTSTGTNTTDRLAFDHRGRRQRRERYRRGTGRRRLAGNGAGGLCLGVGLDVGLWQQPGRPRLGRRRQPGARLRIEDRYAQLTDLPWNNINTIDVQFSGPVSGIAAGSLKLAVEPGPDRSPLPR